MVVGSVSLYRVTSAVPQEDESRKHSKETALNGKGT